MKNSFKGFLYITVFLFSLSIYSNARFKVDVMFDLGYGLGVGTQRLGEQRNRLTGEFHTLRGSHGNSVPMNFSFHFPVTKKIGIKIGTGYHFGLKKTVKDIVAEDMHLIQTSRMNFFPINMNVQFNGKWGKYLSPYLAIGFLSAFGGKRYVDTDILHSVNYRSKYEWEIFYKPGIGLQVDLGITFNLNKSLGLYTGVEYNALYIKRYVAILKKRNEYGINTLSNLGNKDKYFLYADSSKDIPERDKVALRFHTLRSPKWDDVTFLNFKVGLVYRFDL